MYRSNNNHEGWIKHTCIPTFSGLTEFGKVTSILLMCSAGNACFYVATNFLSLCGTGYQRIVPEECQISHRDVANTRERVDRVQPTCYGVSKKSVVVPCGKGYHISPRTLSPSDQLATIGGSLYRHLSGTAILKRIMQGRMILLAKTVVFFCDTLARSLRPSSGST